MMQLRRLIGEDRRVSRRLLGAHFVGDLRHRGGHPERFEDALAQEVVDPRTSDLLEDRADEQQSTTEAIASDLDSTSRDMQARTERLGERATDLAERTEQIAGLQRTMYAALLNEYDRQGGAIEQKAESRLYRMFNKKEGRNTIDDLRRRLQSVRGMLAGSVDPDATIVVRHLEALQSRLNRIAPRFE